MIMRQIKNIPLRQVVGSESLYLAVRAAFVSQGSSLNRWCIANAINRQTADRALRGGTTTRSALKLIARIVSEAFPEESRHDAA